MAIISFGFEQATARTLKLIARDPGIALIAEAGAANPGTLMQSIIGSLIQSIAQSIGTGHLTMLVPKYMREVP